MNKAAAGEVSIVSSVAALEALAPEWDELAATAELPTLSHAWTLSCARSLHREADLHVITVRTGAALVGAAPLAMESRSGAKRLSLMGCSQLGEPAGVLFADETALGVLARALVRARLPVLLARMPEATPLGPQLRVAAAGRGLLLSSRAAGTVGVPISCDWDTYLSRMSSRRRYDLRHARRRAERSGKVAVRMVTPPPEQVEEAFEELVRVEASSWKLRAGSSLRQRNDLREFFLGYARLAARTRSIHFGFLDVDSRPVAAQLSVEHANRLWVLKIGYDEAWSTCSPGWQLLAETMRWAFERRLASYEFFGSDEPWLHGWTTEPRGLRTVAFYPASWSGLRGLIADTVGRVMSRLSS